MEEDIEEGKNKSAFANSDFSMLLINHFAKMHGSLEVQGQMIAAIMAQGNEEKHRKLIQLYFEDSQRASERIQLEILEWLRDWELPTN